MDEPQELRAQMAAVNSVLTALIRGERSQDLLSVLLMLKAPAIRVSVVRLRFAPGLFLLSVFFLLFRTSSLSVFSTVHCSLFFFFCFLFAVAVVACCRNVF